MSKHALLSASGASRWLTCTPSAKLEAMFPSSSSTYAEEGSAAHSVAELATRYLLGELTEKDYENQLAAFAKKSPYYNAEMLEYAMDYARFIREKVESARAGCPDAVVELEVKVDFSEWVKAAFGTSDCIIIADDWLEIVDFKYGKGNRVDANDNPQMKLYALGAYARYRQLYDFKNIRMTIFQPRFSGEQSTDEIGLKELLDWANTYVKPRAKMAYAGKGNFAPGEETCKFCRAKEQCRTRAEHNLALFDDAPDLLLITPNEAGTILERASDMHAWLKDLENLVLKTLFAGEAVDGWKLVEGRSNRKFIDEDQVANAMRAAGYDDAVIFEQKLIPLTQMEKDFGKKVVAEVLADFIMKPPGKPTLAPFSDKRPVLVPDEQVLAAFDEA